ncbi:hypothetical protein NEOLEDRAFT_1132778 [Neolentinus lepideus HHB14362 ss-1]|uniref:Uncharacterized protein n=1 Tax=Neolentinus lepideus HHB14362 ss-1 TaxID=1314782 RepID=A0A165T644_9AGAM|nr:hypothetical protein NEOLEDRAFT_1132778 [Neolentinus lepideus HHB14362 ss-1]
MRDTPYAPQAKLKKSLLVTCCLIRTLSPSLTKTRTKQTGNHRGKTWPDGKEDGNIRLKVKMQWPTPGSNRRPWRKQSFLYLGTRYISTTL